MSLFNYNFFPILFFLIWNILYVKPIFHRKSNYQSSLYSTLKRGSGTIFEPIIHQMNYEFLVDEVCPELSREQIFELFPEFFGAELPKNYNELPIEPHKLAQSGVHYKNSIGFFQNQTNNHKNLFEISLQPEITISARRNLCSENLKFSEQTSNKFSDYIVKERPVNLFREEKQSITNTSGRRQLKIDGDRDGMLFQNP